MPPPSLSDAPPKLDNSYASASWENPSSPANQPQRRTRKVLVVIVLLIEISGAVYRPPSTHRTSTQPRQHEGRLANPDQLTGTGRIYLFQVGKHSDPYTVVELAGWLRSKYSVDTQLLPSTELDRSARKSWRSLYNAEDLIKQIKREHPTLAADPNAYLIGFTDEPIYSAAEGGTEKFSFRDQQRTAIISSDGMDDSLLQRAVLTLSSPAEDPNLHLRDRLRRILLRDVGMLFWHLPLNNDPGSLLYYQLYPRVPTNDLYQSDLAPMQSRWGEIITDPCLVLSFKAGTLIPPTQGKPAVSPVTQCQHPESADLLQSSLGTPDLPPDVAQERVELRFANGSLVEKHTDFFLPGTIPIRFERALSSRWETPVSFGMSGIHNYDRALSSRDDMQHIDISNAGTGDVSLVRSPKWLSWLPFARWRNDNPSMTLKWKASPTEHFDLERSNGEVDSYLPCEAGSTCYLNGYQNGQGSHLSIVRDSERRLLSLTAPDNKWLHLSYDPDPSVRKRISAITDSEGHRVLYRYNPQGQLTRVTYSSGETLSYLYDKQQNLLSVSSAASPSATPTLLITNQYDHDKLIKQTLPDGTIYEYGFLYSEQGSRIASVTLPTGVIIDLFFYPGGAVVHQRDTQNLSSPTSHPGNTHLGAT